MDPDRSCQCRRHPEPCHNDMTQEDLLCDICREQSPRCAVMFVAPPGTQLPARQIGATETMPSPWQAHGHVRLDHPWITYQ